MSGSTESDRFWHETKYESEGVGTTHSVFHLKIETVKLEKVEPPNRLDNLDF
jgi:hypothetical protein